MHEHFEWIATAAFGLEGVVARELDRLGIPAKAENGGARFTATFEDAMRANLWLRCADRVLLVMGRFEARSFEELFEGVKALPWEDFITAKTRFPVSGNCARSQLMSIRDCQAITKKAIVERLKAKYRTDWFEESGETVAVSVTLHGDIAQLTLPHVERRSAAEGNHGRSAGLPLPVATGHAAARPHVRHRHADDRGSDAYGGPRAGSHARFRHRAMEEHARAGVRGHPRRSEGKV